jgi:hypothetical protein
VAARGRCPAGLDWITALRAPQVEALIRDGDLQLSLFDVMDLPDPAHHEGPGERPHARITEGNFGLVAGTMTGRC